MFSATWANSKWTKIFQSFRSWQMVQMVLLQQIFYSYFYTYFVFIWARFACSRFAFSIVFLFPYYYITTRTNTHTHTHIQSSFNNKDQHPYILSYGSKGGNVGVGECLLFPSFYVHTVGSWPKTRILILGYRENYIICVEYLSAQIICVWIST